MVDRICVVLEALSVVICLHHLYGKKFRFDIVTVSFLTIEMITIQAIDYFGWPSELSMLFYPIVAIYCIIEFGFDLKKLIVNNVMYLIIIGILQIMVMLIFGIFSVNQIIVGIVPLLSNTIILLIILFVFPRLNIGYFSELFNDKERLLLIALGICVVILAFWLTNFKKINFVNWSELLQYILFSACIVMIGTLIFRMSKYKIKSKEIETELRVHKLYSGSFDNLIDNIRSRQHEFDNHINTIYSQHYIYDTYDKLVEAQQNYCQMVTIENRFNKLLISGNPIIIGFLYGKFVEIDKLGIEISYKIKIDEFQIGVPIYKMVEILGNLISNAVEALIKSNKYNNLYVFVKEKNGDFDIEVRNESDYINYEVMSMFFSKGYSEKGNDRGLGLFHVKNICDEYELNLLCQNIEIDKKNWISFTITNKKETI